MASNSQTFKKRKSESVTPTLPFRNITSNEPESNSSFKFPPPNTKIEERNITANEVRQRLINKVFDSIKAQIIIDMDIGFVNYPIKLNIHDKLIEMLKEQKYNAEWNKETKEINITWI